MALQTRETKLNREMATERQPDKARLIVALIAVTLLFLLFVIWRLSDGTSAGWMFSRPYWPNLNPAVEQSFPIK
jgi:hypothetical protein